MNGARTTSILVYLAACSFEGAGVPSSDNDGGVDAAASDGVDAASLPDADMSGIDFLPPSEETFSSTNWNSGATVAINTTSMTITPAPPAGVTFMIGQQVNGAPVAILRVGDFTIGNGRTVTASGDKPLAIVSDHDITIAGTLDVGAHLSEPGSGGSPPNAGTGAGGSSIHDDGSGSTYDDSGGGGGSFGTRGAAGGRAGPFNGGAAGDSYSITGLIGGSGGGSAGACANLAGAGGGALLLYGHHKIRITGAVTAGGGGGVTVCSTGSGAGAGGGSGGLIWLQTPDLDGTGALAANGGGGGGASYVGVSDGGPGEDGRASSTVAALGGIKANHAEASAGGNGAVQGTAASPIPALAAGNGGGGGGGPGRVVYRAPSLGTIATSPTAVVP